MKTKEEIIVRNSRILEDYFNIPMEDNEDLLKRKDKNIKEFISKYNEELFNSSYDKFKEFTNETGISFFRIYQKKSNYQQIYLSELGIASEFKNDYEIEVKHPYIFKQHLVVYIYVDDFIRENDNIYVLINNEKKLIYKENEDYVNNEYNGYTIRNIIWTNEKTFEEKINTLKEMNISNILNNMNNSDIKHIECIYPYDDMLILSQNGDLYVNDKLYAKNVRELCSLTSYRCYIIFNDESVEFFVDRLPTGLCMTKCRKTLSYNGYFIANLYENGLLKISTVGSDDMASTFDYDDSIDFVIYGVDDFSYTKNEYCVIDLTLNIGEKEVKLPLDIHVWR